LQGNGHASPLRRPRSSLPSSVNTRRKCLSVGQCGASQASPRQPGEIARRPCSIAWLVKAVDCWTDQLSGELVDKVAVLGSQQWRPLGSNILHALIPLLGAGNEAVLSAGKDTPVGVRIRCLLECIRNAKQYLGLALMVCSKTKAMPDRQRQGFFSRVPKSEQNKVSHVCAIITPSPNPGTSHRMDHSYCVCNFLRLHSAGR